MLQKMGLGFLGGVQESNNVKYYRMNEKSMKAMSHILITGLQSNAYVWPRLLSGLPLKRPLKFPPVKNYYINMSH